MCEIIHYLTWAKSKVFVISGISKQFISDYQHTSCKPANSRMSRPGEDQDHQTRINNNNNSSCPTSKGNSRSRTNLIKMHKSISICSTIIAVSLLTLTASAFNLENRLPLTKFETAGSYFGYSVAEHVQTDGQDIKW